MAAEEAPAKGLTAKQRLFAEEYAVDFNGARAAKAAGYAQKSAKETAYELLKKPEIQVLVEQAIKNAARVAGVSQVGVLKRWKAISDDNEKSNPAVSLRAAELMGKHLGMFTERHEISGLGGGPIEISDAKQRLLDLISRSNQGSDCAGAGEPDGSGSGSSAVRLAGDVGSDEPTGS